MTPVRPASVALAAVSLVGTGLLSPGWVFGKYPNLAAALARGEATSAQVGDASPAYLLLHVLTSPLFVRWLQAGAAALTVMVLFDVLSRSAGLRAAWLGAGALAVAQPWLVYSAVMEPDLLIGVAVACGIALLDGATTPRRLALAGLAVGLAVSLRPTTLLFFALVLAWLLVRKTPLRAVLAFAVAALLMGALPSLLLRVKARQDLRGTMSAGQVFHQSHRPESLGFGATFPSLLKVVESQAMASGPHPPDYAHELYRELARVSEPSRTDAASAEAFWFERTLAYFRLEPLAVAGQSFDKAVGFLAPPAGEYDIPAVQPLLEKVVGLPLRWLTLLAAGSLAAERAVARYGTTSPVDATLAAALWAAAGRCDTALELADRAAESNFAWALGDLSIDPLVVASEWLVQLGRSADALERLERSNHAHPGRLDVLARLVAAGDVGQPTSVERWEAELNALHDSASVHFALARARRRWGDPQGALADADWLRTNWPLAAPFAEHERALALLDLHRPEEALQAWARTLVIRAGLHEDARFDPLVKAMVEAAPEDARVRELAAMHWRRRGRSGSSLVPSAGTQ